MLEWIFIIYFHMQMQVLALVGDQLDYGDNICGAVLSIRFNEDILSVWNRNSSDHQVCNYCLLIILFPPLVHSMQQPLLLLLCYIRL